MDVDLHYRSAQPLDSGATAVTEPSRPPVPALKMSGLDLPQDNFEDETQRIKEELEEQKIVINQLIDQLHEKTLEIVELRKHMEEAFKETATAKTDLATCKLENEQLASMVE